MIDRRKAIRNTLLGIGTAASPKTIYKLLSRDDDLKNQLDLYQAESEPFWHLIKSQFKFADAIKYFNNASLGSSPLSVIDATEEFRRTLESFPSRYMWGGWKDQIQMVKADAAGLLNAEIDEIAIIHNTTEGMNVIANSLDLKPGDEVILSDHEHRTGLSPWIYHQEKKGVKLVRPTLPLVPDDPEEILNTYVNAITPKTKVISMVHMTNTNGMILPVKEICEMARAKGILTLIDGAQSLGAIPCDMKDIGCDFFTASGHKWLFSPKGVGLFYTNRRSQKHLKPFIANFNYDKEDISKIDDYNTRNLPDVLGLGAALNFHKMVGIENQMNRTKALKKRFLSTMSDSENFKIKTPLKPKLSHQIITMEKIGMNVKELQNHLIENYKIDVRGMGSHSLNGVRISFAMYHDMEDVDILCEALLSA